MNPSLFLTSLCAYKYPKFVRGLSFQTCKLPRILLALFLSIHSLLIILFLLASIFHFKLINFSSRLLRIIGRFKCLVESEEDRERFRAKYRIPPLVGIRYAVQGEWADDRKTREVVIPMTAFIEGEMTIPMGTITRNYLRFFRLYPTQCAPNMFMVLGSVEALNERMNLGLTYHDVNWVYSLHHLKGQGYYLKSRYFKVRIIQRLSTSNKGLKEDFFNLFWGMARQVTLSDQGGDTRWGTGCKFCTLAHFFLLFRTILQTNILPHLSLTWSTSKA